MSVRSSQVEGTPYESKVYSRAPDIQAVQYVGTAERKRGALEWAMQQTGKPCDVPNDRDYIIWTGERLTTTSEDIFLTLFTPKLVKN